MLRHLALLLLLGGALAVDPAGAFELVYEGYLEDAGAPAHGRYEMTITPQFGKQAGAPRGAAIVFPGVEVERGRFRLEFALDEAAAEDVWLALAVRAAGEVAAPVPLPGLSKALAGTSTACWAMSGDAGTDPSIHFLGTLDAQPLVVRTHNTQSLRIDPSAELFAAQPVTANITAGSASNSVKSGVRGATISGGGLPSGDSDPDFGGEAPNRVFSHYGSIGGGYNNRVGDEPAGLIDGALASVGGGAGNTASGYASAICGGMNNASSRQDAAIGGGRANAADGNASTISGGVANQTSGNYASVGGGHQNLSLAAGSRIGGGTDNSITLAGADGTIAGGSQNAVMQRGGSVGGGTENAVDGDWGTVAGGSDNLVDAVHASIGGGQGHSATGGHSTIAGGFFNRASGVRSAVSGGSRIVAAGTHSMVSGGFDNCAGGGYSWAGGQSAKVRLPAGTPPGSRGCADVPNAGAGGDEGTFVWSDAAPLGDFVSTGSNQFLVRATGGIGFGTNSPASPVHVLASLDGVGTAANHVLQVENAATGSAPDVLALKVGTATNPGASVNFITFFAAGANSLGAIEGNGAGGVVLVGPGNDFAEYLPKLHPDEQIQPGDILGVHAGRVSRRTTAADRLVVASKSPIVAGNDPGAEARSAHALVALVGQAEVRVAGAVAVGDWVAASGLQDGSGRVVSPHTLPTSADAVALGQVIDILDRDEQAQSVRLLLGASTHPILATLQQLSAQNDALRAELQQLRQGQSEAWASIRMALAELQARAESQDLVDVR
jgi:hypothetical protein